MRDELDERLLTEVRKPAARTPRAARPTAEGLRMLEAELRELEDIRLPELAERIGAIRQMAADLSESGEYYEALEELSRAQARIAELRFAIGTGEVRAGPQRRGYRVQLGSTVELLVEEEHEEYQLVGSVEADPMHGRISDESPLGSALIGHAVGDVVSWRAPGGLNRARILKVA